MVTHQEFEWMFESEVTDNSRDRDVYGKLGKTSE